MFDYKQIRFRAKGIGGGIFRGDLLHEGDEVYIRDLVRRVTDEVKPETIAPLVGLDVDGYEVYEGDKLITKSGIILVASIFRHAKVAPAYRDVDFTKEAKDNGWKLAN